MAPRRCPASRSIRGSRASRIRPQLGLVPLGANYLRSYFAQIRRKLEPDPARPRYFITEARVGYRFTGS